MTPEPMVREWLDEATRRGRGYGDGEWVAEVCAKDGASQRLADMIDIRITKKFRRGADLIAGGTR